MTVRPWAGSPTTQNDGLATGAVPVLAGDPEAAVIGVRVQRDTREVRACTPRRTG